MNRLTFLALCLSLVILLLAPLCLAQAEESSIYADSDLDSDYDIMSSLDDEDVNVDDAIWDSTNDATNEFSTSGDDDMLTKLEMMARINLMKEMEGGERLSKKFAFPMKLRKLAKKLKKRLAVKKLLAKKAKKMAILEALKNDFVNLKIKIEGDRMFENKLVPSTGVETSIIPSNVFEKLFALKHFGLEADLNIAPATEIGASLMMPHLLHRSSSLYPSQWSMFGMNPYLLKKLWLAHRARTFPETIEPTGTTACITPMELKTLMMLHEMKKLHEMSAYHPALALTGHAPLYRC